jgi:hypothetical protein
MQNTDVLLTSAMKKPMVLIRETAYTLIRWLDGKIDFVDLFA